MSEETRRLRLRAAVAAGLAGYLLAGMAQLARDDRQRRHLFPVFAWNMFAYAPVQAPFAVVLTRNDGRAVEPSLPIEDALSFASDRDRSDAAHTAHTLAESLAYGDAARLEAARRSLEARLLKPPFAYEVYEGDRRLGVFASGEASR